MARSRETITVVLKEGELVTIEPTSRLKPLPRLDGHVPKCWKDAIY